LVEDNSDLAQRLAEGLRGRGFAVDHAADGETGYRLGYTEDFDAIILDLARIMHHMPRFFMPGPHAYSTRTPSIGPVWIGVRQLAVQRVWV
jgi:hypothetical protein